VRGTVLRLAIVATALCSIVFISFPSFPSTLEMVSNPQVVDRALKGDRLTNSPANNGPKSQPSLERRLNECPWAATALSARCQHSTPDVPLRPWSNAFATPTPMIEPIRVCELDAGSPKAQVPRFQIIAAIRSAKTIAKPALLPTCSISSTGKSEMIPKATAPEGLPQIHVACHSMPADGTGHHSRRN
jgi:hypothetical protein